MSYDLHLFSLEANESLERALDRTVFSNSDQNEQPIDTVKEKRKQSIAAALMDVDDRLVVSHSNTKRSPLFRESPWRKLG